MRDPIKPTYYSTSGGLGGTFNTAGERSSKERSNATTQGRKTFQPSSTVQSGGGVRSGDSYTEKMGGLGVQGSGTHGYEANKSYSSMNEGEKSGTYGAMGGNQQQIKSDPAFYDKSFIPSGETDWATSRKLSGDDKSFFDKVKDDVVKDDVVKGNVGKGYMNITVSSSGEPEVKIADKVVEASKLAQPGIPTMVHEKSGTMVQEKSGTVEDWIDIPEKELSVTVSATEYLRNAHKTVESLFDKWKSATDDTTKGQIFNKVKAELCTQTEIEEQIFYPTVRHAISDDAADNSIGVHAQMIDLLVELKKLPPSSSRYNDARDELIAMVNAHYKKEENSFFPALERKIDATDLKKLGWMMAKAKTVAPTEPHPRLPTSPPGNWIAGPLSGLFDKLKHVVSKK
eukprot:TRINITY_DN2685_c0_g1_i1.p1 TRINITY_DN2685_c0_g1~~TRINITY_DN2685_c0_g1_i1.p1  ORF type:complete len:453 (-),score=95.08 TRINITY_DN2685_c0_g1_i1:55-1251(-)